MVLFGSIADETTDPSTSILGIRVVSSTNPVLSDDSGCARINEEAGINIIQKKSACTLHVDLANRSIIAVVLALFNEPTTIVAEAYIKGQGWTAGGEVVCKELGNGFYGLDVNDSDGFIWDCFASVIIDNPTYDYSANFRVWSELPVVDIADPAEWMEYISTPAEPERFWTPVAFVDRTELSRFSLAGSSDVSPVNNVTANDMYWLSPESALDVRVNDKLAVSVTYTIPVLLGGEYTFAKLVYKPQFRPTSPDDGQVIDLEIHPGVQQTQVITDMNLAQPWWFVIYTNRNESEAVELDVHILAPQLNRVSLYEYNNAQVEYKILPYIYSPYVNITLVAKIGSTPQSASDGDKFMLLQENAVEAVMTELAENTTYYFAIFVEDGNGNTASSNVMQLTTSERLLPPATISQTSVNIDYIIVDFTIPELVDNTYDYIRIVFKADSEPTTDTDGSYYSITPDQTHVTKQLAADTTYYVAIFSKDIYGKEVKSNVVTATTSHYVMPSATLDSVSIDVVTATVTCTLPELPRYNYATAILAVKKDSGPVSTADADVTASLDYSTYTQQTAVVDSLNELSTYYFKIFTTDSEGNEAQSNVIHAETGTLLKTPTILQLTLGEREDWDGSEIDIMWSGQNNKMTAQIDNSQIIFTLYVSNTAIYSFVSPVGTSVEDIDNIQASFLVDEENQVAKPSFIYYNGSTYSYNQEEPTAEEMANIYLWLNPPNPTVLVDINQDNIDNYINTMTPSADTLGFVQCLIADSKPNLDSWLPEGLEGFQSSEEFMIDDCCYTIELKVHNIASNASSIEVLSQSSGTGSDPSAGTLASYTTIKAIPSSGNSTINLTQRCQPIHGDTSSHYITALSNLNLRDYIDDNNPHIIQWKFHYKLHSTYNDYSIDRIEVYLDGAQLVTETIYNESSSISSSTIYLGQGPMVSSNIQEAAAIYFPFYSLALRLYANQSDTLTVINTAALQGTTFDNINNYVGYSGDMWYFMLSSGSRITFGNDVHLGLDLIDAIAAIYAGTISEYVLQESGNTKFIMELNQYDYATLIFYYNNNGTWTPSYQSWTITNRTGYTRLDHVYFGMATYKAYAGIWFALHYTSEASNSFGITAYYQAFNEGYKILKSIDDLTGLINGLTVSYEKE